MGDDDAGSGTDAPGEGEGLLVVPGSYSGRLTPGVDPADFYAFEVRLGDVVKLTFEAQPLLRLSTVGMLVYRPDGTLFAWVDPMGLEMAPDVSGRWSARVTGDDDAPYQWTLAVSHHAFRRTIVSREPWLTAEIALQEPGFLLLQMVEEFPMRTGETQRTFGMFELWGESDGARLDRSDAGAVDVDSHGRAVVVPGQRTTLPVVSLEMGGVISVEAISFDSFNGSARMTSISSQGHRTSITIISDHPVEMATLSGHGVVHWRASDNGTILAPDAHVSDGEARTYAQTGNLVGWAVAVLTNLTVEAPDGHVYDRYLPPIGARSQLGPWTLRAPPRADVGVTDGTYFLGAFIPQLGLHTPPRMLASV